MAKYRMLLVAIFFLSVVGGGVAGGSLVTFGGVQLSRAGMGMPELTGATVIGTMLEQGKAVSFICKKGNCQPCVPAAQLGQIGLCQSPASLWVVATGSSLASALLFLTGILIVQRKREATAASPVGAEA